MSIFYACLIILLAVSFLNGSASANTIYLYGEHHGVEWILKEEVELWRKHYNEETMRHLFIEFPYYTAEFLNLWMQAENDEILDGLYMDWEGTASYSPHVKQFYQTIKEEFPETVFHGTDVGHQYHTTGKRYLDYLKQNGWEDSEEYNLAQEAIKQGQYFYSYSDDIYRENKLVENFIREFDKLAGESVMGIYGGAHTDFDAMDYMTGTVPSMANQLKQRYDMIYSQNLALQTDPLRSEQVRINGQDYEARFLAKQDLTGFQNFIYREFWRLEDAYEDFKNKEKTGDVLPYNNYPMEISEGQVFRIDYALTDGSVMSLYYRSDGDMWNDLPVTEGFILE